MQRPGRRLQGFAAAALLTLPQLAAGDAAAGREPVCQDLAYLFYVLAEYEGRGDSKASQLRWVQESFGRDGDPQHERLLERALEYVYATDATPREIHADVRRSCSVDERGRAVFRLPGL